MKQFALLIIYSTPSSKSVAHITSQALWPNRLISPFIIHLPLFLFFFFFWRWPTYIYSRRQLNQQVSLTHQIIVIVLPIRSQNRCPLKEVNQSGFTYLMRLHQSGHTHITNNSNLDVDFNTKLYMSNLITYLNWTPIFECKWFWCGSKNGYYKDMCFKEIALCAQNMFIILDTIVDVIGGRGPYMVI